ncbi:MAG: alpha/beta fold hydrolase [Coriobacteriia bacterium]|nr:alpha/beta fold hydrolase [Coriobacteriia bacterium]
MPSRPSSRRRAWPLWVGLGVVVGIALVMAPFLVRVPEQADLAEPEDLADEDSKFVEIDGIRFHYKDQGDPASPRTIVFLHGFASSLYSWRHAMAGLRDRYRVIAFDRPGFGLSGRPLRGTWQGTSPYTNVAAAEQTRALMDVLGVEKAVLVGHSQGSSLSVILDALYPERVEALVLVNTPTAARRFRQVPDAVIDWLRAIPQVERLSPLLARPFFGRNARAVMSWAYHDPTKLSDETIELELKATHVRDWDRSYVELTPTQAGLHVPEAMAAVTAPTLVIAGRNDRTVPYRDQVRAARAIPGARLITFDATGHVVPEERPGAFLEVLEDFLGELDEV